MSDFVFEAPGRTKPSARTPEASPTAQITGPAADPDPATRLPLPAALATAVASGLTLWTSFPVLNWWPAAPIALAGFALATKGQRPHHAFGLGLAGGLAFFLLHVHWSGVYVGLLPWTALATFEALFLAAMCSLFPSAWRAPGGRAGEIAALTGLWVAQEAIRGRVPFGGFPWARIAFSQSQAPTLGYAALGGAPLVTAVVALIGACLAVATVEIALATTRFAGFTGPIVRINPRSARMTLSVVTPTLAVAAVILLGGLAVLQTTEPPPGPATAAARSVQVAAVQGDVPEAGLDFNAERRAVLDNHAEATLRLAGDVAAGRVPQPDVVLWPENSSDIDPLRNPDAYQVISSATDAVKAPVLVGALLDEPAPNVSNTSILWGPTGSDAPGPGLRYVKRHPAPFAEYIPYRSFFRMFSDKVDLVRADYIPGRTVGVLPVGSVKIGAVICFEVTYDNLVRDTVKAGADLLVVQTNNATFGYTDESVQQLAMSRIRAVETGRAVVHISTVGVSALIMPDGSEVARSKHFTQQVLQARLPLRTGQTVAIRVGAIPEGALAAVGLLLTGWGGYRTRVARRSPRTVSTTEHSRGQTRDGEQESQL